MNLPDPLDRHALAELARDVAEQAGRLIVQGRPDRLEVSSKSSRRDIVTEMDQRAQDALCEALAAARPDDAILGEEQGGRPGTSGLTWVLDPIDGTVNYLYGLPGWSVCVGLEYEGVPIVGVVAAPTYGVTYYAAKGMGAFRETATGSEPVVPSTVTDMSMALTATGFGYAASRRAFQAGILVELLPEIRDIRRAGSAAVDICWVADGKVDAFYEKGLNPWDFTAASVVTAEVGVVLAGLDGREPNADLTIAANPELFVKFHDRLKALGADRPA